MDPAERARQRDYKTRRYERLKRAKLCTICGQAVVAGKTRCEPHLAKAIAEAQKKRDERTPEQREAWNAYQRRYQKKRRARRRSERQFEEFRRKIDPE